MLLYYDKKKNIIKRKKHTATSQPHSTGAGDART